MNTCNIQKLIKNIKIFSNVSEDCPKGHTSLSERFSDILNDCQRFPKTTNKVTKLISGTNSLATMASPTLKREIIISFF